MKRRLYFVRLIWIFVGTMFLASFSQVPDKEGTAIRDEAGRTVLVPATPGSVVSLSPSNTEILIAIGAGDMVIGVTDFCNYPPRAARIPKVGGFSDVNLEKIAEINPDIILASHLHISKIAPALETLGFPVVVVNPVNVSAVFTSIEFVGHILKKEYQANILAADLRAKYQKLSQQARKKESITVYWELSQDLWTIGKGSYIDDLIAEAGGENIAKDLDAPWLQLSSEFILNANPQIIFLAGHPYGGTLEALLLRPGWNSLIAVKNNRVIEVTRKPGSFTRKPCSFTRNYFKNYFNEFHAKRKLENECCSFVNGKIK